MQNQVVYPESYRIKVNDDIFGKNGITGKIDIDTFGYRLDKLRKTITEKDNVVGNKKLLPYFENKLLPLLNQHVIGPVRSGKVIVAWTNNNCESANHVFKTATKWKYQDMPKFIEKLYNIVKAEEEEMCRAIRGSGSYQLDDRYKHQLMDVSQWATLSTEAQQKRIKRFLADTGKSNTNTVVSTDGTRTAQKTPSAGRKPGQRKRKCSERSRTPVAKKKTANQCARWYLNKRGIDINVSKGDLRIPPGVQHADAGHNDSTMQYKMSERGILGSHQMYNTLT